MGYISNPFADYDVLILTVSKLKLHIPIHHGLSEMPFLSTIKILSKFLYLLCVPSWKASASE